MTKNAHFVKFFCIAIGHQFGHNLIDIDSDKLFKNAKYKTEIR